METFKLVVMYALEVIVVAVVGITLVAGVYQLARDQLRALTHRATQRQVPLAARAPKGE
jgi:hypothetical protein